jgi:co-chaperonin GroES (HSP10)
VLLINERTNLIQKTASGIFLPTSATSSPLPEATVIAVGPGAPDKEGRVVPTSVKAGDRVLLPGWGGNTIKVGEDVRRFLLFLFLFSCVDWEVFFFNGIGIFPFQGF